MLVAVHSPTVYEAPCGAWWFDQADQVMNSYYLPGFENLRALGSNIMSPVQSAPQWEYWAQRMADRTPWMDSWEAVELSEDSSPQELLRLMGSRRSVA